MPTKTVQITWAEIAVNDVIEYHNRVYVITDTLTVGQQVFSRAVRDDNAKVAFQENKTTIVTVRR